MQNIIKTVSLKMICFICSGLPRNSQEVLEINHFGYHLTCDHVMADVNDQNRSEYGEN